jgi:predicted NBD/HSP70 family sugar kinase
MSRTGDTTLLRKVNQSAVLEALREQGPLSRSDLARRLQLSPPTITRIIADLLEAGIVREQSVGDSTGGRRPTLLEFNTRASLIVGVYIGQSITGALADLHGNILARHAAAALPGEAGIERLMDVVGALRAEAAALALPVRGVGVGAPSIVQHPEGVVVLSPSLGWRNLPLKALLEARLGVPVFVENEVNLIALGESWRGAGQGIANLVCLSLGAGIGAGIIIDGRLYRGFHHAAGEVGYIIPGEQYLGRVYDPYGCLEGLAGTEGIVQRTRRALEAGALSVLGPGPNGHPDFFTAESVLHAARAGDQVAAQVVDETVTILSIAVANLACTLDPERIVISGELAAFGDLFIEPIRARLEGALPVVPDIVLSELKIDAPILGAVVTVLRETSGALTVQPARA